jgi:hypothetical protein
MTYALPIAVRPLREQDRRYIYSTSVHGLSVYSRCRRNKPFIQAATKSLVMSFLGHCQTLIACHPEYAEQIFGYLIYGSGSIFWVFTKKDFRCEQVASRLLRAAGLKAPINCCFKTAAAEALKGKWSLTFDPTPLLKVNE